MSLTTEQQELCLRDLNKWNTDSGIQTIIPSRYAYRLHTDVDTRLLRFPLPSIWRGQYLCTNASIMSRFLNMLENGTFREHREVTYYADCLCVTSKYLSEVSKKVSGYTANYWINRYTTLDISRLLRDKSLTFVRISDMFGFPLLLILAVTYNNIWV